MTNTSHANAMAGRERITTQGDEMVDESRLPAFEEHHA